MSEKSAALPIPRPSKETEPFWNAAKEHRLVMPRCEGCARYAFPPTVACAACGSEQFAWVDVSGYGKVFSFVVFHRVYHPAFRGKVPYVVAVIELAEGPRIISNVVGMPVEDVVCEMPVRVVFDDVREGMVIPQFAPRT
jgi:uncharacterized OB-fold protein